MSHGYNRVMPNPRYEYSRLKLSEKIAELTSLKTPYGLTVRYAMKANPHPEILRSMHAAGIHFDASSSYEAQDLLKLGVQGSHISLSSQQSAHGLDGLLANGVMYVATSMRQLETFLALPQRPATVGVRINPDLGGGGNNRTNTGGINASFGIWHEYLPQALSKAKDAGVSIDRLHIHIGSGADPAIWGAVMDRALVIVEKCPDVTSLDIGGGYKVHRYGDEKEADMKAIFEIFSEKLVAFKESSGRRLAIEIEPGTYFVAHIGTLVARVDDIVDTGHAGRIFLRLNTGMNDFLRTTLYGARHNIEVINDSQETRHYIVVGHNCESGDIFTTAQGDPESIEPRELKEAQIGDDVRIYDTGAYCAGMRAKGYNSFPEAPEVFVD